MSAILVVLAFLAVASYSFLIYPFLLLLAPTIGHREERRESRNDSLLFVTPFYNEAEIIQKKVRDFDSNSRLILISDGCTDQSPALAIEESRGRADFSVLKFPRMGKSAAIMHALSEMKDSDDEIVILSDVNVLIPASVIEAIKVQFQDLATRELDKEVRISLFIRNGLFGGMLGHQKRFAE